MIIFHTKLNIADNSGGRFGQCIKVLKGAYASIGNIVVVVIMVIFVHHMELINKNVKELVVVIKIIMVFVIILVVFHLNFNKVFN